MAGSGFEVGPQGVEVLAQITCPSGKDLVQLDAIAFRGQPGAGHVEPPDLRRCQVRFGDAFIPVLLEVFTPALQCSGVVDPQVLMVLHLQAGILDRAHNVARAGQLPVREHVLANKAAPAQPGVAVVRTGDAMVEQLATGTQPGPQEAEVGRVVAHADVLDEPDGADGVEPCLSDVTVVEVTDLDQVIKGMCGVALPGPHGLVDTQRPTPPRTAVVPSSMTHHDPPPGAGVAQPL